MSAARRIRAVVRKDLTELLRSTQTVAPLIIVPVMVSVIFPVGILLLGNSPVLTGSITGVQSFIDNLPPGIAPDGLSPQLTVVYAILVYFLAPFFLLIPVMAATVLASASLVGEKERRTIEGLLYTPLSDRELVLAKILGSVVPSVAITWGAFVLYTLVLTALGGPRFGGLFFPTWTWIVMILVLVPLMSFLATALVVAISGRATTVQGAQSVSVLMILPVIALIVGQAAGILFFTLPLAFAVGAGALAIDLFVFRMVVSSLRRERIITRL